MRAVLRSHSVLKCGEDYPLHNRIALAIWMYAIFREGGGQSAVFSGERGIEVDKCAMFMARKAFDAAIHIADRLDGLNLLAPRVAVGRKDCAEDNLDILLFRHLCHNLYIFHYQAVRDITLILCDIVCATADNNFLGVAGDDILLEACHHLCRYLTALAAVYKVILCEKLGVSAVLGAIPAVEDRVSHKYSTRLGVSC